MSQPIHAEHSGVLGFSEHHLRALLIAAAVAIAGLTAAVVILATSSNNAVVSTPATPTSLPATSAASNDSFAGLDAHHAALLHASYPNGH